MRVRTQRLVWSFIVWISLLATVSSARQCQNLSNDLVDAPPVGSSVWTSIGPLPLSISGASGNPNFNVSGRIVGIAAHPTDSNTIYIAAAGGGVWKTTNATAGTALTWIPLTDGQASLSMGAIAV